MDAYTVLGISAFEANAILQKLIDAEGQDTALCEQVCAIFFRLPVINTMKTTFGDKNKKEKGGWFEGLLRGSTGSGDMNLGGGTKDDDSKKSKVKICSQPVFERIGSFYVWHTSEDTITFQHFMWAEKDIPFEALPVHGVKYYLYKENGKFSHFGREERGEYRFSFQFTACFLFLMHCQIREIYLRVLQKSKEYNQKGRVISGELMARLWWSND